MKQENCVYGPGSNRATRVSQQNQPPGSYSPHLKNPSSSVLSYLVAAESENLDHALFCLLTIRSHINVSVPPRDHQALDEG